MIGSNPGYPIQGTNATACHWAKSPTAQRMCRLPRRMDWQPSLPVRWKSKAQRTAGSQAIVISPCPAACYSSCGKACSFKFKVHVDASPGTARSGVVSRQHRSGLVPKYIIVVLRLPARRGTLHCLGLPVLLLTLRTCWERHLPPA